MADSQVAFQSSRKVGANVCTGLMHHSSCPVRWKHDWESLYKRGSTARPNESVIRNFLRMQIFWRDYGDLLKGAAVAAIAIAAAYITMYQSGGRRTYTE